MPHGPAQRWPPAGLGFAFQHGGEGLICKLPVRRKRVFGGCAGSWPPFRLGESQPGDLVLEEQRGAPGSRQLVGLALGGKWG